MRKITLVSIILCLSLVFAGCGSKGKSDGPKGDLSGRQDDSDTVYPEEEPFYDEDDIDWDQSEGSSSEDEDTASEGDEKHVTLKKSSDKKADDWSESVGGSGGSTDESDEEEDYFDTDGIIDIPVVDERPDGPLNGSELEFIEEKFNTAGYNGFLTHEFKDPRYINWNEVFYDGAGLNQSRPSKKVQDAYLKATGEDEIMTDLVVISKDDVESYVESTTGYEYSKMRKPLGWTYLKDYDLYIAEHGDTNRMPVTVLDGYAKDGKYIVYYKHDSIWGPSDNSARCVTFIEGNKYYCFISNVKDDSYDAGSSGNAGEYVIPGSDTRYVTEEDLEGLTSEELRYARNEIFARHGRRFQDKDLQSYFDSKSWYNGTTDPKDFDEHLLNQYESYNRDFIVTYEKNHSKKK